MKYTQVRADAFQTLQMNAGIMVDSFDPTTGEIGNILGATTGGFAFASNPTYQDFGEDVDNVPPNTWQLKRIQYYDPAVSGTFLTVTAARVKSLTGAADVDTNDSTHVVPRNILKEADFADVWVIGDYSDVNTGNNAGYLALHLIKVLNTAGIQWQSTKDGKGQFSFEYHGHYDLTDIDTVPLEIYRNAGSEEAVSPYVRLDKHTINVEKDGTYTLHASVYPAGTAVTWTSGSSSVATVANGVVTGEGAGNTIITAAITKDGVTYNDTCTVIVTTAS